MVERLNCWEYRMCGRELGGAKEKQLGICPASTYIPLDGTHDGIAAGRACWVIAGTMCRDRVSGTFAQKLNDCRECDFYQIVEAQERDSFIHTSVLLEMVDTRARLL